MMLSQNALLTEAVEIQMKHEILKKQHRLPRVCIVISAGISDVKPAFWIIGAFIGDLWYI